VDFTEFLNFPLQPMPQRALWSKLFQKRLGFVKRFRGDVPVLDKQLSETALHFGFRKHGISLDKRLRGTKQQFCSF
jgi:hypothetical protein